MTDWHDRQPIFRQLAELLTQQILQGIWKEGDALPSVRSVAADMKINHITVMKGYQVLVDQGFVEKRLGQGMFVTPGAKQQILETEKVRFREEQIPQIADTLKRLDIPLEELIQHLTLHIKGDQ
ncbi:GntR family transcriptional regulator [Vibrio sp. YIC-376]|uniref:GntR family transcriptional regulator n=1 Tax=Vibrio sp. YIC-376 TaxID=3136162 RepID=UPI00402A6EA5